MAPYGYDWLDNLGRRSPRRLTPGLERLAVGQRLMTFFELVAFEPDRHLTVVASAPGQQTMGGELAASYVVVPRGERSARLVVKLLVRYPRGPVGWAMRAFLPWGDLVMMRKQLLTLKQLAEAGAARRIVPSSHAPSSSWGRCRSSCSDCSMPSPHCPTSSTHAASRR